MFAPLAEGFARIMDPWLLLMCFAGTFAGTLVGVLPGLGPSAAIAVLLPITFGVDPLVGLVAMAGIYYGAMYGGTITSVLLNVPGESASVVTTYDGHPLAKQGKGGVALGLAAIGSFLAGTIGLILLSVIAVPLASVALVFGPPEYFAIMVLAFVMVSSLARGNMVKSFVSLMLGLLLATIGQDVVSGQVRLTWGTMELIDGIGFIPAVVGLFGLAEVMFDIFHPPQQVEINNIRLKIKDILPTWADIKQTWGAMVRGGFVGFFLGILPGGGAMLSSFASYSIEKKIAKDPSRFGRGAIEGVIAPEASHNACDQTAFIPTLSLGIPAKPTMAIMLGALMIHGITPGPNLMADKPDVFWGLVMSFWIGNLMLLVVNIPLIGMWVRLLSVPYHIMYPAVLVFVCVGIYSENISSFEVVEVIMFGVIGCLLRLFDFPPAPLLLGFILGPMAEEQFRRSMLLSGGDFRTFIESPISAAFLAVTAAILIWALVGKLRSLRTAPRTEEGV
jgi:putative tricarboxylic transport membrane protein